MKKFSIFLISISIMLMAIKAFSQSNNEILSKSEPIDNYIILNPQNIVFSYSGGSDSVQVLSNVNWTVTESYTWISVSPGSGSNNDTLLVTCNPNTTSDSRTGIIIVAGSGSADTVNIIQEGLPEAYLIVDPDNQIVIAGGGTFPATVNSNVVWNVTDNATWVTLSVSSGSGNGNFNFTCTENTGADSRSAVITISAPGVTDETINVLQYGQGQSYLIVDPDNQSVVTTGGTFPATVSSNVDWIVTDDASWITLSVSTGSGNGNFNFICTANSGADSRSAVITISASGVPDETINVLQYGQGQSYLIVDPDNQSVESTGGTFPATVSSNIDWNVTDDASWITLSVSTGSGNGNFNFICIANSAAESRSATITISATGVPEETINVLQYGQGQNYLIVDPDNQSVEATGGTFPATVSSNITWNVSDDATWITLSASTGTGDGNFNFICTANTAAESRSGTITIYATGVPDETINVLQFGQGQSYLIVDPDNQSVISTGGTFLATVSSNVSWTATDNATWITLSTSSGSGNGNFNFTCTENTAADSRSAIITITATGIPNETINVLQYGQGQSYLIVDPDNQSVIASGGTFPATVSSNVDWNVSDNATWITLSTSSGSGNGNFNFTCSANTAADSRSAVITITSSGIPDETIHIFQYGQGQSYLIVDPDNQSVTANGGTFSASVSSNETWNVTDNATWITLSTSSGSGDGNFNFTCELNPSADSRSAIITITATGVPDETINVFQYGQGQSYMIVDPDNQPVEFSGGTFPATVSSNVSWNVTENAIWITLSMSGGTGDGNFNFSCTTNSGAESRSAVITISSTGLPDETINVLQFGQGQNYLVVDPDNKSVFASGGTFPAAISSNVDWSLTDDASWITLSSSSGSGNGNFNFTCNANTNAGSRSGVITISATGVPNETINVLQYGQGQSYLIVDPDNPTVLASGGNFIATVYSNVNWQATDDKLWISIDTTQNRDITTFKVTCEPNEELSSRVGHVTVSGIGVVDEVIEITQFGQSGNFLQVTPIVPNVSYQQSDIEFSVTTNIDWIVTEDANWITSIYPSAGSNSGSFIANYEENLLGQQRQAIITVNSSEITVSIILTQDGNGATVSLGGVVKTNSNVALPDVIMSFISESGEKITETDESGSYMIYIPSGGAGSLRPEKTGMIFSPTQIDFNDPITINQDGLNFIGGYLSELNLTFTENPIINCKGFPITLSPVVTGATSSADYSWTSSPVGFTSNEINPVVNPQADTYYILNIVDINGGSVIDSVLILPKDIPIPKGILGTFQVCRNQAGQLYNVETASFSETYEWKLIGGGEIISGEYNKQAMINWGSSPGYYELRLITQNKDYNFCSDSNSIFIEVLNTIAPLAAGIELKETDVSCILISMDTTADFYQWGYTIPGTQQEFILDGKTERFCEVGLICDSLKHAYWVETWFADNNCISRSYYNYSYPVGISDLIVESKLKIFPNPANDIVNIFLDNKWTGKVDLRIYNNIGNQVVQKYFQKVPGEFSTSINLSGLTSGLYILTITGSNQQVSKKIIINQ